jgi:hypothetical protein
LSLGVLDLGHRKGDGLLSESLSGTALNSSTIAQQQISTTTIAQQQICYQMQEINNQRLQKQPIIRHHDVGRQYIYIKLTINENERDSRDGMFGDDTDDIIILDESIYDRFHVVFNLKPTTISKFIQKYFKSRGSWVPKKY